MDLIWGEFLLILCSFPNHLFSFILLNEVLFLEQSG